MRPAGVTRAGQHHTQARSCRATEQQQCKLSGESAVLCSCSCPLRPGPAAHLGEDPALAVAAAAPAGDHEHLHAVRALLAVQAHRDAARDCESVKRLGWAHKQRVGGPGVWAHTQVGGAAQRQAGGPGDASSARGKISQSAAIAATTFETEAWPAGVLAGTTRLIAAMVVGTCTNVMQNRAAEFPTGDTAMPADTALEASGPGSVRKRPGG